jgi:hypothetical protein
MEVAERQRVYVDAQCLIYGKLVLRTAVVASIIDPGSDHFLAAPPVYAYEYIMAVKLESPVKFHCSP